MCHPIDVTLPPLRPCMGGNPQPGCGLRLTPTCPFAYCYWLRPHNVRQRPQAYDHCSASFLRPSFANSSIAFCIQWFKFILRHCRLQVHLWVFAASTDPLWSAIMQGLQGGSVTSMGWRIIRVSSSRGAGLHFRVVVVFWVFHSWLHFCATFSYFQVGSVFCVLQKACLTPSLHFFNWFSA